VPTILIFPLLFLVSRVVLSTSVTRLFTSRLLAQRQSAVRAVNAILLSTIAEVSLNVGVLLAAVYGLRHHLSMSQLVLVVCSVYAATVLHTVLKLVLNAYWLIDLVTYLLRHGLYGPKTWLRAHVTRQVEAHFRQMGIMKKFAYRLSGAPPREELIDLMTHEIWKVVAIKVLAIFAIIIIYLALFSLHIRPILIADTTHLNWIQAFLWPFAYAVDYFLPTHCMGWVKAALQF
jgi:hypothetical protein